MKINLLKRSYVIFAIILLVTSIVRLWNLSTNPPHLSPDEASLGYNAYSILKTGKDEYGEVMPVIFKSFGDYKPGLYIYATVPFVAVFGLNEWSVRLPSAVAGVLAVFLLYLSLRKLLKDSSIPYKEYIPLLSSFFLAIAPWHIHFSRGAWEINVSLTLTLAGLYFLLRSFEKPFFLILASFFFSLTLLTYQGAKLSTSLVLLAVTIAYFSSLKTLVARNTRVFLFSLIIGLLISAPILFSFLNGQAGRLQVMSAFSYPRPEGYLQNVLNQGNENSGSASYTFFHTENLNFARAIVGRWMNHYSGRFLFFEGDWLNVKHSAPYHGVFTLADLLFFIPGIFVLLKYFKYPEMRVIALWLLFAPLPAAFSKDQVHAVRAYNLVIPMVVILASGSIFLFEYIRSIKVYLLRLFLTLSFVAMYSISYVYFLDLYFVHNPYHNARYWDYGYKQVVQSVQPIYNNYPLIKVQQSFAQPYIYFLFYGIDSTNRPYDPEIYQKQAVLIPSDYKNDVGNVVQIDNIFFVPINWPQNRQEHGILFVGDEVRIPPYDSEDPNLFDVKKDITFPNGERAFRVVEVK